MIKLIIILELKDLSGGATKLVAYRLNSSVRQKWWRTRYKAPQVHDTVPTFTQTHSCPPLQYLPLGSFSTRSRSRLRAQPIATPSTGYGNRVRVVQGRSGGDDTERAIECCCILGRNQGSNVPPSALPYNHYHDEPRGE